MSHVFVYPHNFNHFLRLHKDFSLVMDHQVHRTNVLSYDELLVTII
jgi:hypothetical protein